MANRIIEASAGTGKTQALAQRLIDLLRHDVAPQALVALTFSRAAAGEIFERFVMLLSRSAENDPKDAARLRQVIATQHLSCIGTMDSFLMHIVQKFPLELGLSGTPDLMDDYHAAVVQSRVSFSTLRRTDAKTAHAFAEAFSRAMNQENVRSFVASYRSFISNWHAHVLSYPKVSAWGCAEAIWHGESPVPLAADELMLAQAADRLCAVSNNPLVVDFAAWVRNFRGSFGGVKGLAKKLLEMGDPFAGATIEVTYKKKFCFAGGQAEAIRAALRTVFGFVLRRRLNLASGIYALIRTYETEYARTVRQRGQLVFADIPRLIAALPPDVRRQIEYRLDAKISAWALDEFQDTSREQWSALAPLVEESKQSNGERSVFIVGDKKQAIYGWRNGDVGIFSRELASGAYEVGELNRSFRSGRALVDAVNRVFVDGRIRDDFPRWTSPVHETAHPECEGFVQVVTAASSKADDFVAPVYHALKAADPIGRGFSAAVLVRSNTFGEMLAAHLKLLGLENVVWEGESAIYDTPALTGFLDLVALADHPGDEQAYRHFCTTRLAAARYPNGVPPEAEVSAAAARAFTANGLVRTFRALRALLPAEPEQAWSRFTEDRFTDFLRAASEFELAREPGVRLSDFSTYLASRKVRNLAEPSRIKIMTIHRSKGLGFDYVVLPLYESSALNADAKGPLVGPDWILPDPGKEALRFVPGLSEAAQLRRDRAEQESLCTYYVAMTRAKVAMTVVASPPLKSESESIRFSDLVRDSLPQELGDREWAQKIKTSPLEKPASPITDLPLPIRAPRTIVRRRLPSQSFQSGMSAGRLFDAANPRGKAMNYGIRLHERLQKILWLNPEDRQDTFARAILASPAWRAAFVRTADVHALWRERAFEILVEGKWISGQFDRVVFTGKDAARRAVVYDFKTNRPQRGESREEFVQRMETAYSGQLVAYRDAVVSLTGLPPEAVSAQLLLASDLAD